MTNKLKVWSRKIQTEIDEQIEKIHKRDYKFYKIDRLERMVERVDEFSNECSECITIKKDIEDITPKISYYLAGASDLRAEYEKRNEKIVKHLQKEHKLAYKDFFASSYSFIGLLVGTTIVVFTFWFINPNFLIPAGLFGFTIGLFIGRFIGKRKDKENEKNNLIL